jgi:hypothetical protein
MDMDRRTFAKSTLGSLLTYSLLETLVTSEALGAEIKPLAAAWLAQLDALGRDVKGEKLTQIEWQKQTETLFAKVDLADLLKFADFEKLTKGLKFRERGELALKPKFPKVEGLPTELVYGHQIFALKKGQSVVPHGHDNMCTGFLILEGEFHGRHYDRLEDSKKEMIIKPTIDRKFKVAEYSTISEQKDNVHWFKATSERGFIFNIHVLNVHEGRSGRVYIDPNGEKLAGGKIRARKIRAIEAFKLYR